MATISVFDNGGVPKVHPQSRGLVLALDPATSSLSVAAQFEHSRRCRPAARGTSNS